MKLDTLFSRCSRLLAACAGLALVAQLSACGGAAGAGAQGGAGNSSSASNAASIQLFIDKPSLKADGTQTGTLAAVVKDAQNNVVTKQPVAFTTTDNGSSLVPGASPLVTDSSGKATATLSVGASNINRTVTVTATAGSIVQTLNIPVVGTAITMSGAPTLAIGGSSAFVATLRDAGGNALAGVPVAMTSSKGNGIALSPVTTDGSGQASFTVIGSAGGSDTLTASALGASGVWTLNVAAPTSVSGLSFSPATANVAISTPSSFAVTYTLGSVPQPNKQLTFSLTRGSFVSNGQTVLNGTTDANGQATVSVTSPTAGTATLTAVDTNDSSVVGTATLQFFSGAANATKVSLSPSITTVGVNAPGSSSNSSVLTAVVRDASDNPVSGATVAFSAVVDPSGGSLSPATAVTDSAGMARSSFIAGANSTGFNGVQLKATVASNPSANATANLTVSQVALYIDLGTGNTIETPSSTTYLMPWSAIVTDAARGAQANTNVSVSLTAVRYLKGVWTWGGAAWVSTGLANTSSSPSGNPGICLNEDVNNNNFLDAGEDKNGNNRLDPGSPASVAIAGPTGADGTTKISITYPRSFGGWVEVTLRATVNTPGTQSSVERTFILPTLGADIQSQTTSPPAVGTRVFANGSSFLTGPYGWDPTTDSNGFCTSPN